MSVEPCFAGRCYSPLACEGWGYCRERNDGRCPTEAELLDRRAKAERAAERARADRASRLDFMLR